MKKLIKLISLSIFLTSCTNDDITTRKIKTYNLEIKENNINFKTIDNEQINFKSKSNNVTLKAYWSLQKIVLNIQ